MHMKISLISATAIACVLLATGAGAQTLPANTNTNPNGDTDASRTATTEDVIVTAQKRGAETLLTVPVPVAVVDTGQLAEHEQVKFQDFAAQVPGFTVAPAAANQSTLSIRGINTGGQGGGPTVGITLDDVPFVSAAYQPELDPGDLERIEVLRGPQGTLYGANAMGGLLRFVSKAPSTSALSGQIAVGTSGVAHGDDLGYSVRASMNIPVSQTLAVRVSGFVRKEPGYIFDVLSQRKSVNEANAEGGRAAVLYRPSDKFSVELTGLVQTIRNDASDEVVPAVGTYSTNAPTGSTASRINIHTYTGVVNADLGSIKLTSITGYNTLKNVSSTDFSYQFGPILRARFGVAPYADVITPGDLKAFTQEGRLDTTLFGHLDVQLAGFFYGGQNGGGLTIVPPNPITGALVLPITAFNTFSSITHRHEIAAFGSLTYHFSDRFDIQVGARESHLTQTIDPYYRIGNFNNPNPLLVPGSTSKASPFTFLVTPQFKITPELMIYARAASGYRQGGSNTTPGAPPEYSPDKTYNYEVGLKGKFLNGKLTADLSVFHIDWKDIQLQLRTPLLLIYFGNGGQAKSEGVEFTVGAKPARNTSITGWFTYDNAVLTADFVNSPTYGRDGDRLPNTPKYAGHIAVRQSATLADDLKGFVEADGTYTGRRFGIFQATALRQLYPSYKQVDVRAGLDYRNLSLTVYVNNIVDERGILNGGLGFSNPNSFIYIRPRTIGGALTARF